MGRVKMNIPPRAHKPPMIHQNKFKVGRYFLYGNFDECKNAQFNFSHQNLRLE